MGNQLEKEKKKVTKNVRSSLTLTVRSRFSLFCYNEPLQPQGSQVTGRVANESPIPVAEAAFFVRGR